MNRFLQPTQAFVMGKVAAAGGVYSNIEDLTRLMSAQIKAYNEFQEHRQLNNPLVLTEDAGIEGDDYGFGLGKKVFETETQYGHGGDMDGFASAYLFSPEYQSGVILLTSSGGRWLGELEKQLFYKLTNREYTPPKKSMAQEVYNIILSNNFADGKKWFEEHQSSTEYYLSEAEMNNVGYALLEQKRTNDAIEVFKLNTSLFPDSTNVYDSLREAYSITGNTDLAIQNYERVIALDPQNENAKIMLQQLKGK